MSTFDGLCRLHDIIIQISYYQLWHNMVMAHVLSTDFLIPIFQVKIVGILLCIPVLHIARVEELEK